MSSSIKRLSLALVALLAAAALAACGSSSSGDEGGSGGGKDVVKVQLDYQPRGDHAMFYVGKEKGFFAKHGIEVSDINIGTGSPDAMRSVGKGQSDFAFGDLPTMATAVSQGVPDVALVAVNVKSPMSLCTLADKHPIHSVQDMRGLNMGLDYKGSTFIFYKALLAANDLPRSAVKEHPVTQPYENFLLRGKVDAITCYVDAELPIIESEAKKQNLGPISVVLGADHGYDVLGSGLVTSRDMIKDKPDVVKRFVAAYMEAFRWSIAHPDAAAKIVADTSPELKDAEPVFAAQLQADIKHTFTNDVTKKHGLGYMSPQAWTNTVDVLTKQGVIKKAPSVPSLYDNSFVEDADKGGS